MDGPAARRAAVGRVDHLKDQLSAFARWITGARQGEATRVYLCFASLYFLMISYYLIKPLRSSKFLSEFDPHFLPVMSLGVILLSLIITKIFNYLTDRVEKYRLVSGTFIVIVVIELIFGWRLLHAGRADIIAFYFFCSVYFLLALAATWACINDIFTPEQGERCYGFVALGSTLGGITGSAILGHLSPTSIKYYATLLSGVCMIIALSLLLRAGRTRRQERREQLLDPQQVNLPNLPSQERSPSANFWSDVTGLLRRPYVRRIGIMVMVLAAFNSSVLDYVSGIALDEGVARSQFQQTFPYLSEEVFPVIAHLKTESRAEKTQAFHSLAQTTGVKASQIETDYQTYRAGYEKEMTQFFSSVYFWQGVLGVFLLLVVARLLFTLCGVRFATIILPCLAIMTIIAFTMPISLMAIEAIVVLVGSTNYSLNNAAKELLYTATDDDTKFKYKPLIEGPGMRFGDIIANLTALFTAALGTYLSWSERSSRWLLLSLAFIAVLYWLRAAYLAGSEYDRSRTLESKLLDP